MLLSNTWNLFLLGFVFAVFMSLRPSAQTFFSRFGRGRRVPISDTGSEKSNASGSSPNDHDQDASQHGPSPMDVVVAKMMLQQGLNLPPEVVLSILDHAEYWPHTTATLDSPFIVTSGRPGENRFVLRTKPLGMIRKTHPNDSYYKSTSTLPLPLAEDAEYPLEQFQQWIGGPSDIIQRPCRKIVFTITSHDQGWASNANRDRGTYRGSCTWFEAGLERFDKTATRPKENNDEKDAAPDSGSAPSEQGDLSDTTEASSGPNVCNEKSESSSTTESVSDLPDPYLPVYALRTVYPTVEDGHTPPEFHHDLHASSQYTIQYNKTATRAPTTHKVVWSWKDDADPSTGEDLRKIGRGEETGTGDFVRNLKPGDVVSVWAKSRYGGWANNVDAVKVDVYWAL